MRGRLVLLAVVMLVAATTAGCVSIPESSPVKEGRAVGVQDEPPVVDNVPIGPLPGMTRDQVVAGFFAAMLAFPKTSTIARQFLTPAADAEWDPDQRVVVYDDREIVQARRHVSVRLGVLGRLDARGTWTSAPRAAAPERFDVRLAKVRGQWRIANPEPGTYVDRGYFARYKPLSLYFFDPTRTVLTPDPVRMLVDDTTATALVRDLLSGPAGDLKGVAETAAPAGTELGVAVAVSASGVAEVPLSAEMLTLSAADRQLFAAQLTWTLRQLPEIQRIRITVDGTHLDVFPGASDTFGVDEFLGYDPAGFQASTRQLFALSTAGLVTVAENGVSQVRGPIEAASRGARSAAVALSGSLGAVVKPDGGIVVVAGMTTGSTDGAAVWFSDGSRLLKPSWDVHGVLWLIDRTRRGAVVYRATADGAVRVRAPGLDGRDVASFAVSRDGTRLAAVVGSGRETALVMSTIDRDPANLVRVALSSARPVTNPVTTLTGVREVAWISPTDVVVLANGAGGDRQLFDAKIDGSALAATADFFPTRPVSIAAGPNTDAPIVIGGQDGKIYVQNPGSQWLEFGGPGALRDPTYPG